ncbi:type II toxin-antitoxin system RatA family toxin [Thiomonas sp.]|jgi:ribosome-associated toxin RatA of RatAB toxin-antitoxin module|uniref:type II toxin-antitoxin system RatA family toxin n=1 Tax=Thiomonas sp. TaxID=2047785 RepID=UPI00260E521F|nr:type II toxin-antitoxin system RatA family toxin [Thiomonas sp.]
MSQVRKSVLIWYSAQQMYALVADVASYPQFLPWCGGVEVHESSERSMRATIRIDFKGVRQSFTTQNRQEPGREILMQLVEGPFSQLQGRWNFSPLQDGQACRIEFELDYHFSSRVVDAVIGPVFGHIAKTFVESFVQRAEQVYGSAS